MSPQFSPLDGAFLELEEARERLDALPRFRRRPSSPHPGRLTLPTWEPATDPWRC